MIARRDIQRWSVDLLVLNAKNEIDIRRGVSGLYYGLFHRLAQEGSAELAIFGANAKDIALRAYEHGRMFKTCERYVKGRLDWFTDGHVNEWLTMLARSFITLKEAREKADYDLLVPFEKAYAFELVEQATAGHWALDELYSTQTLRTFLFALLLDERLPRRG